MKVENSNSSPGTANNNISRVTRLQAVFLKRPKRIISNHGVFYLRTAKRILTGRSLFLKATEDQRKNYRNRNHTTTSMEEEGDDEDGGLKNRGSDGNISEAAVDKDVFAEERAKKELFLKFTPRDLAVYGRQMMLLLLEASKWNVTPAK